VVFGRILLKRLGLSLVTLWLLSVIVFAGGQLLPGDVARAMLGPLADVQTVANFNHQFGLDRPALVQYGAWIGHFVTGDMGQSYALRAPVAPFILAALGHSLKLGAVAFLLVVPLGIAGGALPACR
jgi:peptide/nickel transport system permease protein